jgi:plastocyanin
MFWIIYGLAVFIISGAVGMHLGRFREAYTEMTGMMAGMTMGMLNGFVLGFAAAAATVSMFWGNLIGVLLGLALGIYFGRPGGLMGIMDGGMGGVMGGSMGAMLAVMVVFPQWGLMWTAVLLSTIYIAGMVGLVVLIERASPNHAALHRLLPMFARAMATEAAEELSRTTHASGRRAPIDDYYTFLGVSQDATGEEITEAYLTQLSIADEFTVARAERAYAILTDPNRRRVYDARLAESIARGDCCPPPRHKRVDSAGTVASISAPVAASISKAVKPVRQPVAQTRRASNNLRARAGKSPQAAKEPPVTWVGGLAALAIATSLLIYWLANGGVSNNTANTGEPVANAYTDSGLQLPAALVQQLKTQAVVASIAPDGTQTLNLAVNGNTRGYNPKVIKVKQGVPVHFNLSVEGKDPDCGRFVGIEGLGVHGIANPGEVTAMDFTPGKAGIFQINCNMHMMDPGYIIVE